MPLAQNPHNNGSHHLYVCVFFLLAGINIFVFAACMYIVGSVRNVDLNLKGIIYFSAMLKDCAFYANSKRKIVFKFYIFSRTK